MHDDVISLHCPKCKNIVMRFSAAELKDLETSQLFTCSHCGLTTKIKALRTSSGITLDQHAGKA